MSVPITSTGDVPGWPPAAEILQVRSYFFSWKTVFIRHSILCQSSIWGS